VNTLTRHPLFPVPVQELPQTADVFPLVDAEQRPFFGIYMLTITVTIHIAYLGI